MQQDIARLYYMGWFNIFPFTIMTIYILHVIEKDLTHFMNRLRLKEYFWDTEMTTKKMERTNPLEGVWFGLPRLIEMQPWKHIKAVSNATNVYSKLGLFCHLWYLSVCFWSYYIIVLATFIASKQWFAALESAFTSTYMYSGVGATRKVEGQLSKSY